MVPFGGSTARIACPGVLEVTKRSPGYRNTTGFDNTASGSVALHNNTAGYHNTAVGSAALFNNTYGDRNLALGRYAGFLTTGNDNIALANAGVYGESGTTRIGTNTIHTRAFIAGSAARRRASPTRSRC